MVRTSAVADPGRRQQLTFDVHQHFGSMASVSLPEVGDAPAWSDDPVWLATERRVRVEVMDAMGIGRAVLFPSNSYLRPDGIADTRAINDEIAAYCADDPARFPVGVGVVEPLHGAEGDHELRRIADLGLKGVSYHTRFQGVTIDNAWVRHHVGLMAELGLVPLVHVNVDSTFESPVLLLRLARSFPEVPMVAIDALASYQHTLECELVAEECPNVVFETSQAFGNVTAAFAARYGSERVVFGTDLYSHPVAWRTVNTPDVLAGMLGDERAVADVLWRNAERLFGMPRDGGSGSAT